MSVRSIGPAATMDVDSQDGPGHVTGLLVSLLSIFDYNGNGLLTKEEFVNAAGPMGFDVSDASWDELYRRYGDKNNKQATEEEMATVFLDLNLLGHYFANRYDTLLEGIMRRLVNGIISATDRGNALEKRLRVVEEHLEATSYREKRDREARVNQTLRRWKHKYAALVPTLNRSTTLASLTATSVIFATGIHRSPSTAGRKWWPTLRTRCRRPSSTG